MFSSKLCRFVLNRHSSSIGTRLLSSTSSNVSPQRKFGMVGTAFGLALFGVGLSMSQMDRVAESESSKKPGMTSKFAYYSGPLADPGKIKVFSGSGNPRLGEEIATFLGVKLGDANIARFADGEVAIKVNENVRGKNVFILQSTAPPHVNDHFVELLLLVSTLRRSSAKSITVVMPYYAYARSDTKEDYEKPIAARDTMQMLEAVGVDRLIAVDMHSGQMQGFLGPNVPSDNITATNVGALFCSEKDLSNENLVVVAPDAKAVSRTKEFWNVVLQTKPNARFAMVLRKPNLEATTRKEKQSVKEKGGSNYEVVGDDNIPGCDAIIVADIIDSAESICNVAEALKKSGAKRVFAFATHGLFSNDALARIQDSPIDKVIVTNSASDADTFPGQSTEKVEWISIAPLVAESIRRVVDKESLQPLYALPKYE